MSPPNCPPKQNLSAPYRPQVAACPTPLLDPGPSNSSPETAGLFSVGRGGGDLVTAVATV